MPVSRLHQGLVNVDCRQAQQLFDAYLDGELSPSLETELGAHRVQCGDCRRALALLEVSGHIIRADHEDVTADSAFTDRLLACMDEPDHSLTHRAWRVASIGGGLAAAALVALAFLGLFDTRQRGKVAGVSEESSARRPVPTMSSSPLPVGTFEELLEETSAPSTAPVNALQDLASHVPPPSDKQTQRNDLFGKVLEKSLGALEKATEQMAAPKTDVESQADDVESSAAGDELSTADESVDVEEP